LAHESGITNTADPLGGSWFLERLTLDMEQGATQYFDTIDRLGGMVQAVERREKIIVGVNDFVQEDEAQIPILYIDDSTAERQLERLSDLKRTRDAAAARG